MYVENLYQLLKKNLTKSVKVAHKHYFGCKVGDQDKTWAPHVCCENCYTGLTQWLNRKLKKHAICSANDMTLAY